jgi:hypothetical protein
MSRKISSGKEWIFWGATGILVVCSEKKVVFLEYKRNVRIEA